MTQPIQGWLKTLNLSMVNGATNDADTLQINGGGYAVRRVTRLDDYTFWVMSDGYAGGTTRSTRVAPSRERDLSSRVSDLQHHGRAHRAREGRSAG